VDSKIPSFLLNTPYRHPVGITGVAARISFLDKSVDHLGEVIKTTCVQWDTAHRNGFFQDLDARIKVLFMLFFVVIVSIKRDLFPEVLLGSLFFMLAALSRLNLLSFYKKVFFLAFVFGFLIALPSSLNIITRGEIVIPIAHLSKPYSIWMYSIPETIGITGQGIRGVMMLTLRVMNSLTLSFLIIYTTPFTEIMKALKSLKVPDAFLMIMTLCYKYIFIFAQTLEDVHLAKKSKTVEVSAAETRSWIAGRIAFLLRKTRIRCEETFDGMLARGFCGDVTLYACKKMRRKDIVAGSCFLIIGMLLLLL
jgi:cobalt/nickel transport system permease protein